MNKDKGWRCDRPDADEATDDEGKECKGWFTENTEVPTQAFELYLAGLGITKAVLL